MTARGITKVAHLRARCCIDTEYPGCWHWQGARAHDGTPRIFTFDHERGEKRTMSGPKAVWNIAHGAAPGDWLVYRRCVSTDCVNPTHMARARDRAEIGRHVAAVGARKGTHTEKRIASLRKAWAMREFPPTSPDIVLAIRSAPAGMTGQALADLHGVGRSVVSRIRRGESHRGVQA